MSPEKCVCIAGSNAQDLRIFRHQLKEFSDEVTVFDVNVPPPDKFNIIIIDCERLAPGLKGPLQNLLRLNERTSLIFVGEVDDTCTFSLSHHVGKIFHLQKGHTFLEDLQDAFDEIHVHHPAPAFTVLQKFRQMVFHLYGFKSLH